MPPTLQVQGREYVVEIVPDLLDTSECYGRCNAGRQRIQINKDWDSQQSAADTLLHEALHACWSQAGLDAGRTEKQEEQVVNAITKPLLSLIVDNPDFINFLRRCMRERRTG